MKILISLIFIELFTFVLIWLGLGLLSGANVLSYDVAWTAYPLGSVLAFIVWVVRVVRNKEEKRSEQN